MLVGWLKISKKFCDQEKFNKNQPSSQNSSATVIMPSTLQKARKAISKKRSGTVNALHDKSRDSLRLHRAVRRDQRLEKLAAVRSKKEQPILERAFYFQEQVQDTEGEPLDVETVQACIDEYDLPPARL